MNRKHPHPRYPEYLAKKRKLIAEVFGDAKTLRLPGFSLMRGQPDPPHRHHVLATFTDHNGVTYKVRQNYPRTAWYVSASKGGFRMSDTMRTSSPEKGEMWRQSVEAGKVTIGDAPSRPRRR